MVLKNRKKVTLDTSKVDGGLGNFPLSKETIERLQKRGINELFPIQSKTFMPIFEGKDVIGLARTGTGKTLAFILPIVERLLKQKSATSKNPRVLVLAPTRELATQIAKDFESVAEKFIILTVFGGTPYGPQCSALRTGVDVVVGTPGRILDLQSKEALKVEDVQYVVLDEVDRMLDMGFSKDVDSILESLYASGVGDKKPQTLLFSATFSDWVSNTADKYLSEDPFKISLVDPAESKASIDVTHFSLLCPFDERSATISDLIRVYAPGKESRTIIFCQMKKQADELAASPFMQSDCHVLHGDIPQDKRELVMNSFKAGRYRILITTNVAARGIDVPNVDLVIQIQPPKEIEDYIHRSGRTGRAGRKGVSIVFHGRNDQDWLQHIEREAGIEFQRISAPSTKDIVDSFGSELVQPMLRIPEETWKAFTTATEQIVQSIMEQSEASREEALHRAVCCSLATISGKVGDLETRSLLSAKRGLVTYQLIVEDVVERKGLAYSIMRKYFAEELLDSIKNLTILKDNHGFVFDLPEDKQELVKQRWADSDRSKLERITSLPELAEDSFNNGFSGGQKQKRPFFNSGPNRGNNKGNYNNNLGFNNRNNNRGGGGRFGSDGNNERQKRPFSQSDRPQNGPQKKSMKLS